jgi:hypothetical protein
LASRLAAGVHWALAFVLVASAAPALAQSVGSTYTKHDYRKCKLVSDEEPVTERRCVGHAGIAVRWVNDPDSSLLGFGRDDLDDFYPPRFGFAVAGGTIEWRGPLTVGRVAPYAAIVRFQVCGGVSGPCRPELVLFRLEGTRGSCVAASVDAARNNANERARALADGFVANFRCGRDKFRPPE